MKYNNIRGTGVALVTTFNDDGTIDYNSLEKVVNHVISGGVDYLVVMGTTGESVTVTKSEKKEILDCILKTNNGRLPVVYGIGGNNTYDVVNTIKETHLNDFEAVLSVSPYYNKPNQQGLYEHFKAIAESCSKPVILYNVPGRTGKNMSAGVTLRLANDFSNIIGIKEASGDIMQLMEILKNRPKDFMVISGDDALTYPMISLGGDGVISVVANAYPKEFATMVKFALNNKKEEALDIHYRLLKMIGMLFEEGSPSGIKALLQCMGLSKNISRLPIAPVSDELYKRIKNEINNI